jgi:hypothetical protein
MQMPLKAWSPKSVVYSVVRSKITARASRLRRDTLSHAGFPVGECVTEVCRRALEDINVEGNGQSILPAADRPPDVSRDLNYLRGEENVTSGEV